MLKIAIKPSKQFIALILILLLSTEGIVFFLPLALWLKIFLSVATFFYGMHLLFLHGLLRHKKSIIGLERHEEEWIMIDRLGAFSGVILGSSTLTRKVCILRFSGLLKNSKRECVIFRDSVREGQFRELQVSVRG